MQLAMDTVNEQNRRENLPEVEMGIGTHTGRVVVGNIGSPERMKYGVVGSHVNLTSRIQAHTTGGQILISDSTRHEVGAILKLGKQMEVRAKGIEHPVMVSEVLGVGGRHKVFLPDTTEPPVSLAEEIPFSYSIADGHDLNGEIFKGSLTKLASTKGGEARLERAVPALSDLKIVLNDNEGKEIRGALYGKVVGTAPGGGATYSVRFTSMSPEIAAFLRGDSRPAHTLS